MGKREKERKILRGEKTHQSGKRKEARAD